MVGKGPEPAGGEGGGEGGEGGAAQETGKPRAQPSTTARYPIIVITSRCRT